MKRIGVWLARLLLGLLVVLGAGLVLVWIYRVPLAERAAALALAQAGMADVTFSVRDVSLTSARLEGIDLGPDLPDIETLTLRYSATGLLRGQLDAIAVDGLSFTYDLNRPENQETPVPAPSADAPGALEQAVSVLERLQVLIELTDAELDILSIPGIGTLPLTATATLDFRNGPGKIGLDLERRTAHTVDAQTQDSKTVQSLSWRADGTLANTRIALSGPALIDLDGLPLADWTVQQLGYAGGLSLDLGAGDLKLATDSGLDLAAIQGPAGKPAQSIAGRLERPELAFDWRPGGMSVLTIADGSVSLPDSGISLTGLSTRIPFSGADILGAVEAHAQVRQTGPDPVIPPFVQTVSLERNGSGQLELTGQITLPKGAGSAPLTGSYDVAAGTGQARLGPVTVRFSPKGVQPRDLLLPLNTVSDVDGPVTVTSSIRLPESGGLQVTTRNEFAGVDLALPTGTVVEGLSGTLDLAGIDPIRTRQTQTLTAKKIAGPFPLDKPRIRFDLRVDGGVPTIRIQEATGGFAGGTVSLEPFTYSASDAKNTLAIGVRSLSLSRLLDEWAAGRVSGEGSLTGRIPVQLSPEGAIIPNGEIKAEKSGVIQVKWGEAREALVSQGEEVGLMVRALEDFRYERLEIGVSRPAEGELSFAITLAGNNPTVLDAQPFVFNITLSGNLEDLLSALSAGQGLTADLLRGRLGR